jgi:hypothetical protein
MILLSIGEQRGQDAFGAARGDGARGIRGRTRRIGVQHVERHRDHFALEACRARAHVALQRIDVGVQTVGFLEEGVVLHVAAVHRSGALTGLPESVFLAGDRA